MAVLGYVGFYRGRRAEVMAVSKYAAQQLLAGILKAKQPWDVAVELAEIDGKPVIHSFID